jgi:HKD family nuclease
MQLTFINQPFQGPGQRVGDYLLQLLMRNADFDLFRLAVAWAKRGGVQPIFDAMQQFRENGGRIEAVVGIDLKGTSVQGLRLLQQVTDLVTIFQNANRRFRPTYHPKLFVFSGPRVANIILGSSNLTQGGLFVNYEQNVLLTLNLHEVDDQNVFNSILGGYDRSANAPNGVAQLLTEELIRKLIARDLLLDEDSAAAQRIRSGDQDNEDTKEVAAPPLWYDGC